MYFTVAVPIAIRHAWLMASIWKGALSFGLVNVQVKAHPATQDNDISFHQVHGEDGGRIRYKRVCEICGKQVEYRDIARAWEASNGTVVTVSEEELASLPAGRSREIDVVEFVPAEQVDPILFDRTYYLEPEASAIRPYVLLREALKNTEKMAVAHVSLRQKTRLAALRVYEDVIVLQTLLWADEIRDASFPALDEDVDVRPAELKMAASLIETLESDFHPEEFTDKYREELQTLLDRKVDSGEDKVLLSDEEVETKSDTNVVDLMSALQASIDKSQKAKADAKPDAKPAKKAAKKPAKKAAAKKPRKTG